MKARDFIWIIFLLILAAIVWNWWRRNGGGAASNGGGNAVQIGDPRLLSGRWDLSGTPFVYANGNGNNGVVTVGAVNGFDPSVVAGSGDNGVVSVGIAGDGEVIGAVDNGNGAIMEINGGVPLGGLYGMV